MNCRPAKLHPQDPVKALAARERRHAEFMDIGFPALSRPNNSEADTCTQTCEEHNSIAEPKHQKLAQTPTSGKPRPEILNPKPPGLSQPRCYPGWFRIVSGSLRLSHKNHHPIRPETLLVRGLGLRAENSRLPVRFKAQISRATRGSIFGVGTEVAGLKGKLFRSTAAKARAQSTAPRLKQSHQRQEHGNETHCCRVQRLCSGPPRK